MRGKITGSVLPGEIASSIGGWATDLRVSVPPEAIIEANVLIRTVVKCAVIGGAYIRTRIAIDGSQVQDLAENFAENEIKWYDYSITMPNRPITVSAETYTVYQGSWNIDATDSGSIEPTTEKNWWITIARGDTLEELEADAAGRSIHGKCRLSVRTDLPGWMLKSSKWFIDVTLLPLSAIGLNLLDVQIKDKTVYAYMVESGDHPIPIAFIIAAIVGGLSLLGIGIWKFSDWQIEQEITEQLATELLITKTKAEADTAMQQYNLDMVAAGHPELAIPPEEMASISEAMWESGYRPEKEGVDWEKYLKWALIGGGAILGVALIVPQIPRFVRELKAAQT